MTGMTPIVKTIARLIAGLMFVFGVYVVLHGHLTPGGGFAGGVVIAGAFVMSILAQGSEMGATASTKENAGRMESVGILIFWALGLLGLLGLLGGTCFFMNVFGVGEKFELMSAGFIPYCNIGIGIEVGAAFLGIFAAFLLTQRGNTD